MVDELLVAVMAWFSIFGYLRGFLRSLFDALSWMMALFFTTVTIPFLQDHLLDSGWRPLLHAQLNGIGSALWGINRSGGNTVVSTMATLSKINLQDKLLLFNWYFIILLCAISVFIGFQMVWRVVHVAAFSPKTKTSRWGGGMIGFLLGSFIATYLVQFLSAYSWASHQEIIDLLLGHSVILHSLFSLIPW